MICKNTKNVNFHSFNSPVNQDIRMRGLPHQRTKLHDGDEAAKVLHLLSLIFPIHHTRQIEQLGSLQDSNQVYNILPDTSYGPEVHF